ncbi:MAG: hypothetical protein ACI9W6_002997, partial [Motiliproteus sp.]
MSGLLSSAVLLRYDRTGISMQKCRSSPLSSPLSATDIYALDASAILLYDGPWGPYASSAAL